MGAGDWNFIFYFFRLHRNWSWVAEIILISANHMYLVNKEYFFIIPMYYEKTNGVCDNQNSLERATIELKKVNISIIKYLPVLFSVSLRTLLDKIKVINLFCSVWFFLSCQTLSLLYKWFLPVTVHKQHIFFYLQAIVSIHANWETARLYQSALN